MLASEFPPEDLKFKVARPAGGNDFTVIGESAKKHPTAGVLNAYTDIAIPVLAGDVIGLYQGGFGECARIPAAGGYSWHRSTAGSPPGDVPPGQTETFTPLADAQFDIAASLEPDCDRDGLGDETQDSNTAGCGPTPPTAGTATPQTPLTANCAGQVATQVGTEHSHVIEGTPGRDVIAALGGHDAVRGLAGNDRICGGRGKDTLKGGGGVDKLKGGASSDALRGGGGEDRCVGGPGRDFARTCEAERST